MARFYQQVKTLIFDIERFLTESIKDSKIPKKAQDQKSVILNQIRELRNDYPQLEHSDEPSQPSREANTPEPDLEEDTIYEDTDTFSAVTTNTLTDDKREVPASDAYNVTHSGQLKIKKVSTNTSTTPNEYGCRGRKKKFIFFSDKKGNILSRLAAKKCYCVLRDKLFYVYDKKTSKKQNECFSIEGYQVSLLEDEAKKEYGFEMTGDDKKAYIFEAANEEDLQGWMSYLYTAPPDAEVDDQIEELYTEGDGDGDLIEEDLYEDTEAIVSPSARQAPIPSASESPPPVPKQHPPARSAAPPALPSRNVAPPPPPPKDDDDQQDIYDDTVPQQEESLPPPPEDDQDDIYDDTFVPVEERESPKANKSSLFSRSLQQQSQKLDGNSPRSSFRSGQSGPPTPPKKTLPPVPVTQNGGVPSADSDYDNMFYGVWDCKADQEKELSFNRGDIITVVNRNYEDRGWWVGRLHDKIGLVPKNFLSPAYERA